MSGLFSFRGRAGRLKYVFAHLCIIAPMGIAGWALFTLGIPVVARFQHFNGMNDPRMTGVAGAICLMFAMTLWALLALTAKRFHDFNWSAKWIFGLFAPAFASTATFGAALWENWDAVVDAVDVGNVWALKPLLLTATPPFALAGAGLVCSALALVLIFRPGTAGDNDYDEVEPETEISDIQSRLPQLHSLSRRESPLTPATAPAPRLASYGRRSSFGTRGRTA